MYKIIFLIHKYSVSIFLLLYLVKTVLLFIDKKELLAKITAFTKVPEMIISTLFLLSGIYMVFGYPFMGAIFYVKMALVFVSIPVAIVGFKKQNKYMAASAMLFLIGAYGMAEMNKNALNRNFKKDPAKLEAQADLDGKAIYSQACEMCHGPNGDAGIAGSANLKLSTLTLEEKIAIITKGKNSMPKFTNLSEGEISAVATYIESFK